jgi:death-on-curing family protein
MPEIQRMSEDEVLLVRKRMAELEIATQHAFGVTAPLHPDKLASAVFRQYTGSGGLYKYNSVHEVGANLFYGIAMSHAFENGNKRTALVSLLVFLDRNKTFVINAGEDDLYELARSVAAHEIEIDSNHSRSADNEILAVGSWINEHTRQIALGDSAMEFRELKEVLEGLDCIFDKPEKNYVKIRNRNGGIYRTGYPRSNFEIPVGEVKRIRKGLRLDELHGVDSTGFYSLDGKVDSFVNKYRNLMKRLADL